MKYFARILVACLLLAGCGDKEPQQVEFFTHDGCPYCEKALKYIRINYPKLPMEILEISRPNNMQKFIKRAMKYRLNTQKLGTPLICLGDNYIMGWSPAEQKKFNEYVKPFVEANKKP